MLLFLEQYLFCFCC